MPEVDLAMAGHPGCCGSDFWPIENQHTVTDVLHVLLGAFCTWLSPYDACWTDSMSCLCSCTVWTCSSAKNAPMIPPEHRPAAAWPPDAELPGQLSQPAKTPAADAACP